jgi:putative ABC transport system substrate-binding protein
MLLDRLRRREFITLIGGATAWPLAAHGQQTAMPVIGFLHPASADADADRLRAFRAGLKDARLVEGQNVVVEYRWASNQINRLPQLAQELVGRQVVAIIAVSYPAAVTAKNATATIPIVFMAAEDPVKQGSCRKPRQAGQQSHRSQFFCHGGEAGARQPPSP